MNSNFLFVFGGTDFIWKRLRNRGIIKSRKVTMRVLNSYVEKSKKKYWRYTGGRQYVQRNCKINYVWGYG